MHWWQFRDRREEDLERELRSHVQAEADERRQSGLPADEAHYAARRALGNIGLIKENTRATWGWTAVELFGQDLRHAARMMVRRPGFTAVAVLSLAIALGANTAVFSFARGIVLKALPVQGADRLVILRQHNEMFHMENCCFRYPFFRDLRKQDTGFEDVLAVISTQVNLTDGEQTERLTAEIVSGNYFEMLGVRAVAGRVLGEGDDVEGAGVCVISYRLWQRHFGGAADTVGRRVSINAQPFLVVGITEPGFTGAALHEPHDIQVPAATTAAFIGDRRDSFGWAQLIARLKPGMDVRQAQVRLNSIGKQLQRAAGERINDRDAFLLKDGSQGIGSRKEQLGKPVLLLTLLVGAVLLVACANLVALLLVRSVERMREAGMRVALGASKPVIFRQFLLESLLIAVIGGLAGWLLAAVLVQWLLGILMPESDGLMAQVRPDGAVFAFSATATLAAGVLFGMLPAWRAARADPMPAIRGTFIGSIRKWSLSRFILAGQVALSFALLFCAGLFSQTLRNLRSIDLGFRPENVVQMHVDLSRTLYRNDGAGRFYEELLRRGREMPGVHAASLASISLLSGSMASIVLRIPGYVSPNRLNPVTYFTHISSGYFQTLGVPLGAGRDFDAGDSGDGEGAVIVNEQFAREFFGGDALGKAFAYGGAKKVRVVGIARTAKFRWIREEPHAVMYLPVTQRSFPESLFLQMRMTGEPVGAIERVRALLRDLDSRVPVESIMTLRTQIDHALARERLLAFLSMLLAAVAVMLAAIGLYGVLSFSVAGRMREIGIRMAVGAERRRILVLFAKESAWVVVAGIALGLPCAMASGRLTSSLLYGLKGQDTLTAVTATLLLGVVAMAAAAVPAWRASRVDPMVALRHE